MKSRLFPTSHLVAIAAIGLCLCPLVVARFIHPATNTELGAVDPAALASPLADPHATAIPAAIAAPPPTVQRPTAQDVAKPDLSERDRSATETLRIQTGDSLATLFKRKGVSTGDLHRLVNSQPFGSRLKSIYPGHQLTITTADNSLVKLTYSPGPLEKLEFSRVGDTFVGVEVVRAPERVAKYHRGTIDHSLFVASQRAGLADAETMRLAQIFQWDIDFVLDIRTGDSFHVLLEELYLGSQFVGHGNILAAEFVNRGKSYRAVRYEDSTGESSYFSPEGESMRKAFLRAPVSFSRISSNFNLRRKHPLWNRAMPHRGIDYAAPTGTPVMASGDGVVIKTGRTDANGNYIVIRHGQQFLTKYLHLSRFASGLRKNKLVRQGETIGYVGSTGWATGPHLHYEFLVNGVHQDPRTVHLPHAEPISTKDMERFTQTTAPLLAMLDSRKKVQLAYLGR